MPVCSIDSMIMPMGIKDADLGLLGEKNLTRLSTALVGNSPPAACCTLNRFAPAQSPDPRIPLDRPMRVSSDPSSTRFGFAIPPFPVVCQWSR